MSEKPLNDQPIMASVANIRENAWNPNAMTEEVLNATIANVRRFGFNQPILVRVVEDTETGTIYEVVDGAHRFKAAQAVGLEQIPVVVREFTDAEAKAQTLAMNKLRGEMDPEAMARLVREIDEGGIPTTDFAEFSGFTADELVQLDSLLSEPEPPAPPKPADDQSSGLGDSYHVLVACADEAAQLALLERLEGEGFECRAVVS